MTETKAQGSVGSWWALGLIGAMVVTGCAQGSFEPEEVGVGDEDAGGTVVDGGGSSRDGGADDVGKDDGGSDVSDCEPADGGETCNGRDDDCDGEIDEGVTRECSQQEGVCQGKTVACADGSFPVCGEAQYGSDYESDETTCDGLDNDCDGEVDESCDCEPGETQSCFTGPPGTKGNGPCQAGSQTCQEDGTWGECTGETLPGTETCDGTDEDCDGEVDNGVTESCSKQIGVCSGSVVACSQGSFGTCGSDEYGADYESGDETTCDGLDNDCDGDVDESLTRDCPKQEGVCGGTEALCTGGSYQDCSNLYGSDYEPGDETTCDGLDNDCDGEVDESITEACPKQQGVCSGSEVVCSGGSFSTCEASDYGPDYESGDETTCDGLDNDCDGEVDENLTRDCSNQKGVCSGSTRSCSGGSYPTCDSSNFPSTYESGDEATCDGLDNDCDGEVDEGLTGFESVYAGEAHTCALKSDGTAYCWGRNSDGQLGNGSTSSYEATPQEVDTSRKFEFLALGKKHTCGETKTDGTYCWGDNEFSQTGTWGGDSNGTSSPRKISTNSSIDGGTPQSFVRLGASDNHSCGLTASPGDGHCWGQNDGGQMGDGKIGGQNTTADPVTMEDKNGNTIDFREISAGGTDFSCATSSDDYIYCWGEDVHGQLGAINDSGDESTPNLVNALYFNSNLVRTYYYTDVDAGATFACALEQGGRIACWGNNADDQLGTGSVTQREKPEFVSNMTFDSFGGAGGIGDEALAGGFVCARKGSDIYCWGEDIQGQIGDGSSNNSSDNPDPTQVAVDKDYEGVAVGGAHACAWASNGDVYCWGANDDGQLGLGQQSYSEVSVPTRVDCYQ